MQFDQFINDATKTGFEQYATVQQQVLEANKTMAETFGKILPATPAAGMIPGLPEPTSVIEGSFEMAASVLEANKKFFGELVGIWAPVPAETV